MMRNDQKMIPLQLTPNAGISVSKLNEVDGPLVFVAPPDQKQILLTSVDSHERARPDHRVHGEVAEPNVATDNTPRVGIPDQGYRPPACGLNRPRQNGGPV